MTVKQKNRFSRLKKVRALLESYRHEWENQPAIRIAVGKLDNEISFFENAIQLTGEGSGHISNGKNSLHEQRIQDLLWLSGVLYCYADDQNDAELSSIVNVSARSFEMLDREDFISSFRSLVSRVNDLGATTLADYGITEDVLIELSQKAANLNDDLGIVQLTVSGLKALRKEVKMRFVRSRKLLYRGIRNLLAPFQSRNHGFWLAFESSLVIIDRRSGHGPPAISVDDVVVN